MSDRGPTPTSPAEPSAPGLGRAIAVYTGLRLALFAGLAAVLVLAGVPAFPALVGALLGSAVGSGVLLRRQRDHLTAALLARRDRAATRRAHEEHVREQVEQARRGRPEPGS